MSLMDGVRGVLVRLVFPVLRGLILHTPDRILAPCFRGLAWLAYLLTGDKMLRQAVSDVGDILESGPPYSATLRKVIGGAPPAMAASIFKCLRRPSPYEG